MDAPAELSPPPRRRIVITGTSSGIGHRLALRLAAAGHDVWGLARSAPTAGAPFRSSRCDVSDYESVVAAAREVGAAWPAVDALICCAGEQGAIGPAMALDPAEWSRTVRTNLDGTFYTLSVFFPLLRQSGGTRAKVVCFSGGGATAPRPNFSAYSAAKAGLVRLVETLAHEWQDLPIDINAIAPGALPTRLTEEVLAIGPEVAGAKEYEAARQTAATGAAGFERVENLVDYLLHPVSNGITGRLLSAPWDPWPTLHEHRDGLAASDVFTLRRIVPADRQIRL